jgi:5-methylcytosine-specific restriction endonuclease McrA
MSQEKRTCRLCNETKSITEFELDKRVKDGRTNRCYTCKGKSRDKATYAYYKLCQRANEAGEEIEVTLEEVKSLFDIFSGTCIYCNAKESPDGRAFHLEHVIPRKAKGRHHISNLVLACPGCNGRKRDLPVVSHFFNDDRFKDEHFATLAHYLAFQSKQPIEELVWQMSNQHAVHELAKMRNELT